MMWAGTSEYLSGNCAIHRALKASPQPKATSSTCLYDARNPLSAVIGSLSIHRVKAESDEEDRGSKKASVR